MISLRPTTEAPDLGRSRVSTKKLQLLFEFLSTLSNGSSKQPLHRKSETHNQAWLLKPLSAKKLCHACVQIILLLAVSSQFDPQKKSKSKEKCTSQSSSTKPCLLLGDQVNALLILRHIKVKDCSRLSLWQQIRNIESSTKILREVYSRQRRENPTDLHTPQTLAPHSIPAAKEKLERLKKQPSLTHATLKTTITQNRNCRKRMHTSPQHSSSHRKHAHKKKTSKGHALLLPNPGTLLPVMAMEKDEANYNKQLTRRIPFSQAQKLITCANEEVQITRRVVLTNARRRIKTRQ